MKVRESVLAVTTVITEVKVHYKNIFTEVFTVHLPGFGTFNVKFNDLDTLYRDIVDTSFRSSILVHSFFYSVSFFLILRLAEFPLCILAFKDANRFSIFHFFRQSVPLLNYTIRKKSFSPLCNQTLLWTLSISCWILNYFYHFLFIIIFEKRRQDFIDKKLSIVVLGFILWIGKINDF